jgi:hypothetical protein
MTEHGAHYSFNVDDPMEVFYITSHSVGSRVNSIEEFMAIYEYRLKDLARQNYKIQYRSYVDPTTLTSGLRVNIMVPFQDTTDAMQWKLQCPDFLDESFRLFCQLLFGQET